jgi:hypothetical protein
MNAKFQLGQVVITSNALDTLNPEDVYSALGRHAGGDWGDCCPDDWQENDFSLTHQLRLLSVYRDRAESTFWIITEADRSATTVLLPDDY